MPKGIPLRFTEDEVENIRHLYHDKELIISEIAQIYGLSYTGIWNAMEKHGIERRQAARKYTVDEHCFDDLSNEHAAYWLGFVYADGHVPERKTFLQVILAQRDEKHLEKLKAFLKAETPVTVESHNYDEYRQRSTAKLTVSGTHLHERLWSLGIRPGKPDHTLATDKLPIESRHHWLRGFFDGDGSASKDKQMWFCGSRSLMAWVREVLATEAGRNPKIKLLKHTKSNIYYLHYKGYYNAHAVADYLYRDATVWLERKRDVIGSWPEPMSRSERGKRRWLKSHTPPSDSSSA